MVAVAARLPNSSALDTAERRSGLRALESWRVVRSGLAVPTLMDLCRQSDQAAWDNRFLLWRAENAADSIFVVCGAGAREALQMDRLGQPLSDVLPSAGREEIIAACSKSVLFSQPVRSEGSFNATADKVTLYRAVFAPVRAHTDELGYVMGVFSATHLDI